MIKMSLMINFLVFQDSSKEFQEILKSIFSHVQEIEIASNANFFSDRLHGDSLLDFDALHEHLKDLQENVHLFQNLSMSGVTGRDESFKLRL